MADLKMPELNSVIIAGNLTKDPIYRQTTNGTPVVNFSVASNRRYRDSKDEWQEDVCYVGAAETSLKKAMHVWLKANFSREHLRLKKATAKPLLK